MEFQLEHFIPSMNHTFKEMCDMELLNGIVEEYKFKPIIADVSSMITLKGTKDATLILTLSIKAAREVTKKICGIESGEGDHHIISDTVGEILNMLVGFAQKTSPVKFNFSIPITVYGIKQELSHDTKTTNSKRIVSRLNGEEVWLYLIFQGE